MRASEKRYYDLLAPEYDDWALARGRYAGGAEPGWRDELRRVARVVSRLQPGRVLEVACGTGLFTRHLHGDVVGLDQSEKMLEIARRRCPGARFIRGDALGLPFANGSFDLVFAAHFYGHLRGPDREEFLVEARRVAPAIVVLDSGSRLGVPRESVQRRVLGDGSEHEIYKRFFRPADLADELGGGRVLFHGTSFMVVGRGEGIGGSLVVSGAESLGTVAASAADLVVRVDGDPRTRIRGLSYDPSRVCEGDLFFCLDAAGAAPDAAAAAAASGAAALCVEQPTGRGLPEIVVTDVRRAMVLIAAEFFALRR